MHAEIQQALATIATPIREELERFETAYLGVLQEEDPYLERLFAQTPELLRGKRLRPILFYLCKGLAGGSTAEEVQIPVVLEMLHLASLLHDDVVDDSDLRRGEQTLNAVWGNAVSVLAGDYLMARVLSLSARTSWPQVQRRVLQTIEAMTRGELRQAIEKTNCRPSSARYFEIAEDKTAVLFGAAAELGGVAAAAEETVQSDLNRFGRYFGLAFQIHDDILDYSGDGERMGKPVGQDFQDGLLTLPVIRACEKATETECADILALFRAGNPASWARIQNFVVRFGGVDDALGQARRFSEKGITLLSEFAPSPYKTALSALITFDSERTG
ncbi:MAG TPA: polyprenyl synthetase family protein [bacterium]|nr:polyprenyl synthetase family protein [bacterium]